MWNLVKILLGRTNLKEIPEESEEIKDAPDLLVTIKTRFPKYTDGIEQEIYRRVNKMYKEGKSEREIGLDIIIKYNMPCCLSVTISEAEIVLVII